MRVLCSCVPATSRFLLLSPLARAIAAAGHEVAFAVPSGFHAEVSGAGFNTLVTGLSLDELREAARNSNGDRLPPDREAALMFTRLAPLGLRTRFLPVVEDFAPDVIVHEEGEYGGPLMAAALGVPSIVVGWPVPLRSPTLLRKLDQALAETWVEAGLTPSPLAGIYDHLYVDTCPPSLQAAHAAMIPNRQQMRPLLDEARTAALDEPLVDRLPGVSTVHLTFGTVLSLAGGTLDIVRRVVNALRDEPIRLVVSVGHRNDTGVFGPSTDRLIVGRFWPHRLLLPHCDAVICHGGAGSTIAALSHGLPLLILPQDGASQYRSAAACVQAGAGLALLDADVDAASIRASVRALLDEPSYRVAAQRIAAEIGLMPEPRAIVSAIERVAASTRLG